jgi:hypothetical protein
MSGRPFDFPVPLGRKPGGPDGYWPVPDGAGAGAGSGAGAGGGAGSVVVVVVLSEPGGVVVVVVELPPVMPPDDSGVVAGPVDSPAGAAGAFSAFFSQPAMAKATGRAARIASFLKSIYPSKMVVARALVDARPPGKGPRFPVQREPGNHAPGSRALPCFAVTLPWLRRTVGPFFHSHPALAAQIAPGR